MEQNAQAFDNAISWVETARENFDALGQIVKDVVEALEITVVTPKPKNTQNSLLN